VSKDVAAPSAGRPAVVLLSGGLDSSTTLANSKMTLDVYAQLEQRIQRDHGAGFDRLVRQARAQLGTAPDEHVAAAA
jgi:asparagine synthetase B (glutamine-hydrolysing)